MIYRSDRKSVKDVPNTTFNSFAVR